LCPSLEIKHNNMCRLQGIARSFIQAGLQPDVVRKLPEFCKERGMQDFRDLADTSADAAKWLLEEQQAHERAAEEVQQQAAVGLAPPGIPAMAEIPEPLRAKIPWVGVE
jgi:hypothetical protein